VGADIWKKFRHESSVSVFEWCSSGKNRGRNRDLTEGQGEGSDSLSSCVEGVVEYKGARDKTRRSCRNWPTTGGRTAACRIVASVPTVSRPSNLVFSLHHDHDHGPASLTDTCQYSNMQGAVDSNDEEKMEKCCAIGASDDMQRLHIFSLRSQSCMSGSTCCVSSSYRSRKAYCKSLPFNV
jgi:hypothetical protein